MAGSTLITFTCRNPSCPRRDRPVTRFVPLDDRGQPAMPVLASTPVLACNTCGQDMRGEAA
jgi:hypothetical protein